MTTRAGERVAYFQGRIVPESEVRVPFRDRGFIFGDAVFDTTRTFGHRIFKLGPHIERLYRSLRYLRIDPGIPPARMAEITEEVLGRNLPLLEADEDCWVTQRVSRGADPALAPGASAGPTVIVECLPLPLRARARLFRDGIRVIVPSVRRVPPECLSPRAKTQNYLNLITGDLEARAHDPEAWAVLLDTHGNLAEGTGSNLFLVKGGTVMTPRPEFVLGGISRETVIDLARESGIPVVERDLDLYDAHGADEAFLTSTSLCICPVRNVNGVQIGGEPVWGPITRRLADAYSRLVDCDFVAQYLKRLEA